VVLTLSEGRIALVRGEPNFLSTAMVVTLSGGKGGMLTLFQGVGSAAFLGGGGGGGR
jgi:hypothetical protein